ncbi:MAG: PorV/PorQ family protein [Bacteroidota bacterium]
MQKFNLLFIALIFMSSSVLAQAPKYSNEFLSIGVGARALGMSNAYVSTVDDVTAGYWNPAGLLGVKSDFQVSAMHAEYFAGIAKYDYAAIAKPIDSLQSFGISFIRFGVDDIPNTTELIDANGNIDYDRITTFSAADYAFIFSYARKIKNLDIGGNFKIIHRKVGDFGKSWGFGLDGGLKYNVGKWNLALMARDVTSTFNAWTFDLDQSIIDAFILTNNEIPDNSVEITLPRLIFGASRKFQFNENLSLRPELNLDLTTDGKRNVLIKTDLISIDPHLGAELNFKNTLFFRTGIGNIQQINEVNGGKSTTFQPNLGIGVKLNRISLDYALTDIGDQSVALYSNIFSMKVDIFRN